MIQVKNVLGYTDTTGGDTYAVEVENRTPAKCSFVLTKNTFPWMDGRVFYEIEINGDFS